MERHQEVKFAVYYDVPKPHVMVHKIGSHKLDIHGGEHIYQQGGWGYFVEEREAQVFAKAISTLHNLPEERSCQKCF